MVRRAEMHGTSIIIGLFLPSGLIVALIMNTQAATASVGVSLTQ